jgi:nucleoside-diphosphate-sugar epimerase
MVDCRAMILVTGPAGFIGYHVSRKLLERGDEVLGLDKLNDDYEKFSRSMLDGEPILVFNNGNMIRDFTSATAPVGWRL